MPSSSDHSFLVVDNLSSLVPSNCEGWVTIDFIYLFPSLMFVAKRQVSGWRSYSFLSSQYSSGPSSMTQESLGLSNGIGYHRCERFWRCFAFEWYLFKNLLKCDAQTPFLFLFLLVVIVVSTLMGPFSVSLMVVHWVGVAKRSLYCLWTEHQWNPTCKLDILSS